ncbi:MAG: hypothetical protein LCI02_20760 [Proteobacteria bacterium]|nr:hypothetical protein [Pseudomonadota bacterium]
MAQEDGGSSPRKGKSSAFTLLTSWLFNKRNPQPVQAETEFLNTRDGYELGKFAQKAFGNDAEAKRRHEAMVDAEQAEIDALLQGTGAVPMPVVPKVAAPAATSGKPLDLAVAALDKLHAQGLSVETLAEALIIIESREVKQRAGKAG